MKTGLNVAEIRSQFPALGIQDEDRPRIYFDNPAGTQVPQRVIERMNRAMIETNANLGGCFSTTIAAERLVEEARLAAVDFYHAASSKEIIFGASMTALSYHLSRCLAKQIGPGDEIILTRMDHDANVAPWMQMANDVGATVRWVDFNADTYEFDQADIDQQLTEKTKLVAIGYASNCTGTVHDIKAIAAKARQAGALTYVDAVQYAPHRAIDVQDLGCDFLVSSAYKFFGPHLGILWGRQELLEQLFAYQVRPARDQLPGKFDLGTTPRELLAGMLGAIEYFEILGRSIDAAGCRRTAIERAFAALDAHETGLTRQLLAGLSAMRSIRVHGITSPNATHRRVPTVSLTSTTATPAEIAHACAQENIFVWSGHNYAIEPVKRLGLMDTGGVLRIGLAHYNTSAEVDQLLELLTRTL